MNCCSNKRLLIGALVGGALLFGLAYIFQWQAILRLVPFALFLLCPLMHVFMMGSHGGQRRDGDPADMRKGNDACH